MNHRSFPDLIRRPMRHPIRAILLFMAAVGLAACASGKPNQIYLMPAPEVYTDGIMGTP